jgi:lactoylglutathione lyase
MKIRYLHTMVRVSDIEESKRFYCDLLGLKERRRMENEKGRYTLVFLCPPGQEDGTADVELTHNWDESVDPEGARNFGHLAYRVENIYDMCQRLADAGVTINRPPRDGHMAFVKSPDGISIELLQEGDALPPQEPWKSMENTGSW